MTYRSLLLIAAVFWTSTSFSQVSLPNSVVSSVPRQLGSPVLIAETTIEATREGTSILQSTMIDNLSDRAIKEITLGCVSPSSDGRIVLTVGSPIVFQELLPSAGSRRLSTQRFPTCVAAPLGKVTFFVARARYEDDKEYVADLAAIKAELSRHANP